MEYFFKCNELEAPKGHCASTHFVPPTQAMQNQGMVKREIIKTEIQYWGSDSFNNFVPILMAWSNSMLTCNDIHHGLENIEGVL